MAPSYWDPIRKMLGCPDDAEAAGDGSIIAILKRLRTLLGGPFVISGAVTIADGADVAQGALADPEVAVAGPASVVAILKRLRTLLSGVLSVSGTFWQAVQPVSGTFWQATQPVSQSTHDNLQGNANIQVDNTDAGVDNPVPVLAGGPFTAVLGAAAVTATTMYQLIDLSDTTNYPHAETTALILKRLRIHAEKDTVGIFDVWIGVVIENDGTDGTARWLHCFHLEANGNPTDGTDRFAQELEFNLDLAIAAGAPTNYVSNQQLAANALLKNDVARMSPIGTGSPGVGDLMVYVEEVTDGGTLDFAISADYNAR